MLAIGCAVTFKVRAAFLDDNTCDRTSLMIPHYTVLDIPS
jgi:hypothetical protein